jgi:uncharacterized membrane protein
MLYRNIRGATMPDQKATTPDQKVAAPEQKPEKKATLPDLKATISGLSDNTAGGLAYITLFPAIFFLIIAPFKRSPYVRFHAWQSIFFFIALVVLDILAGVFQDFVPSTTPLTSTVFQLLALAIFAVWLIVFIGAFNGKRIKLPLVGNLAERQADR